MTMSSSFEFDGELLEYTRVPFGVTNGVSSFQRIINKIIKDEKLDATFALVDNVTICGHTEQELSQNVAKFRQIIKKYNITLNE